MTGAAAKGKARGLDAAQDHIDNLAQRCSTLSSTLEPVQSKAVFLIVIFALLAGSARATPIVVERTKRGFLLGTNSAQGGRLIGNLPVPVNQSRACKFYFGGRSSVAIRAASTTSALDKHNAVVFDFDRELASALLGKELSVEDLKDAIIQSTEDSIKQAVAKSRELHYIWRPTQLLQEFAVVGFTHDRKLQMFAFSVQPADPKASDFQIVFHKAAENPGELYALGLNGPEITSVPSGVADVDAVLDAIKAQQAYVTEHFPTNRAWDPPFYVFRLEEGYTGIIGDPPPECANSGKI